MRVLTGILVVALLAFVGLRLADEGSSSDFAPEVRVTDPMANQQPNSDGATHQASKTRTSQHRAQAVSRPPLPSDRLPVSIAADRQAWWQGIEQQQYRGACSEAVQIIDRIARRRQDDPEFAADLREVTIRNLCNNQPPGASDPSEFFLSELAEAKEALLGAATTMEEREALLRSWLQSPYDVSEFFAALWAGNRYDALVEPIQQEFDAVDRGVAFEYNAADVARLAVLTLECRYGAPCGPDEFFSVMTCLAHGECWEGGDFFAYRSYFFSPQMLNLTDLLVAHWEQILFEQFGG
ncbi:hypothetical protein [Wenzhouxiangella marina]|uniref:Uncharacterized protein n=1 Tax=Wenzhouxiangella marina TaxID=1579979 RepID=A0A0K0XV11_9GAMM|nr:hypothetical protein [Wenzhouxiangella marina]AKS41462.1 hypothetical protein WM2015_1087 [Wenzhouxiangella marina]MBB6086781.1 hypothetical protein [Wenzhouxiangella marina]